MDRFSSTIYRSAASRDERLQWLMFQMAAIGPMFGQVGFFHRFAAKVLDDKRPLARCVAESTRLLGVLQTWLERGLARPAVRRGKSFDPR